MITPEQRALVVVEAKTWFGTPYLITAAVKGKGGGVDCFQLLYKVFNYVGLMPERQWDYRTARSFLADKNPLYLETIQEFADEIPETEVLPGDVVMYKNPVFPIYTHAAIVLDWPTVIHSAVDQGVIVTGVADGFLRTWTRKVFRFRGQE